MSTVQGTFKLWYLPLGWTVMKDLCLSLPFLPSHVVSVSIYLFSSLLYVHSRELKYACYSCNCYDFNMNMTHSLSTLKMNPFHWFMTIQHGIWSRRETFTLSLSHSSLWHLFAFLKGWRGSRKMGKWSKENVESPDETRLETLQRYDAISVCIYPLWMERNGEGP